MSKVLFRIALVFAMLAATFSVALAGPGDRMIGINVALNTDITPAILADLGKNGTVLDQIPEIDALTMRIREADLALVRAKPYVAAANPDAERSGVPLDTVAADNFANGINTWDLDAINVTDFGSPARQVAYDGRGVYVAVLDTGLLYSWRQYFPEERVAEEYAVAFGGGGGEQGNVSTQPDKWQQDTNSHGTHVTSTILGYSLNGTPVNGVAPLATVIPVKVLNQNGSGWSSAIARGIVYVADLKANQLAGSPVVINMSLGGSVLDAVEKAAIDYAISKGVIIVASAGNEDVSGMGYPGAYAPVISVAAAGWAKQWVVNNNVNNTWWYSQNVADPTNPDDFYIADFSSRALVGQDLDVAAPGYWVVGPYQVNQGQTSYYYLSGTSMASPHVAGIVALMAQKQPALTAAQAENILTRSAIYLAPGCRNNVYDRADQVYKNYCWGADAAGAGLATADAALRATR